MHELAYLKPFILLSLVTLDVNFFIDPIFKIRVQYLPVSYFFRGYRGRKLDENIQCEIFETILEEAKESYLPSIVFEMKSNTPQEMEKNIETITDHLREWKPAQ